MSLPYTRAIVDAIHDGSLAQAPTETDPVFGFAVPTECPNVPSEILLPRNTWSDPNAYDEAREKLAKRFADNFKKYEEGASAEIRNAGPALQTA